MSARDASSVRAVRLVAAAAFLVLAAALAFRFLPRRPPAPAAEAKMEEGAGGRTVDRKEGIRHREYKDGRVWADLRADRFFLGDDGLNHLEGAVEITDYGREDGREVRISADAVAYDKEMTRFTVSGHVRVAGDGLAFATEALVYDKAREHYAAETGGIFDSEALAATGRTIEYDVIKDEIRLGGGFRLEVKPARGADLREAVELRGGSLTYDRSAHAGIAVGRARILSKDAEGAAEKLTFALSEDERHLREASLEKSAKCVFMGGPGERRSVAAEAVRIVSGPGTSRVSSVEAAGGCVLTLSGPSGPSGTVRADRGRLEFHGDGTLAGWTAEGGVLMDIDEGTAAARQAAGETASYSGQAGVLTVSAGRGGTARLEDGRSRVEAGEVVLGTGRKDIRASGGVRCLLKPRPDGAAVGFFSAGEAVFVTADFLRNSDGGGRLRFGGGVRAWQGDASLQAGELELAEATGEVTGRGAVSAALPWTSGNPAEQRRLEAGGREMFYFPEGRLIIFSGTSYFKNPEARLTARGMAITLLEGKREIKDLEAWFSVVVSKGNYEGRGSEAYYDPGTATLVLTGNPVLVEKGKGETRGDKLTFRLADDRILIENKGQGRSITDIKS